jgi:putative heme-binding domain-containing protein
VAGDLADNRSLPQLVHLAESAAPEVRLAALLGLSKMSGKDRGGKLDPRLASKTALGVLRSNTGEDDYIRHGAVTLLATVGTSKDVAEALHDPDLRARMGVLLAWRRITNQAITEFLSDPDPRLVVEAAHAIHDVPIISGFSALAALISRVDCPTNAYSRVIDACFRLGTAQHAQMLASFAKRQDAPAWARVLALQDLGAWGQPTPLDRVNGLWRPLVWDKVEKAKRPDSNAEALAHNRLLASAASSAGTAGAKSEFTLLPADLGRSLDYDTAMAAKRSDLPGKRAFLKVASEILDPNTPDQFGVVVGGAPPPAEVQEAVIAAALQLQTKEIGTPLFARLTDTKTPKSVRLAAVRALAELKTGQAEQAISLALKTSDPEFQEAAVPYLDRLGGTEAVTLLTGIIDRALSIPKELWDKPSNGAVFLAQSAIQSLGNQSGTDVEKLLDSLFEAAEGNRLPPPLVADLMVAAKRKGGIWAAAAQRHETALAQGTPGMGKYLDARWGGNRVRGSRIFHQKVEVECQRCHAVQGVGGTVGPSLDGLGRRATVDQILESIVTPSARFAAGFEMANLQLKDGRNVVGQVKRETPEILVVETHSETGELESLEVGKSEVAKRESAPSPMPDGLADKLTILELRDLVSYLQSLK